jgi:hypothetical protein
MHVNELMELLANRRTRRFPAGAVMPKGPLQFPTKDENGKTVTDGSDSKNVLRESVAAIAFAGVGLTGPVFGDVPYQADAEGGGNVLTSLAGRTALSPDAAHCVALIVIEGNGQNVRFLKRPQNFAKNALLSSPPGSVPKEPVTDLDDWLNKTRVQFQFANMYEKLQVTLPQLTRDSLREELAKATPPLPTFNKWASNADGCAYFLPVLELSEIYLSILFGGLEESSGYFIVDDRNGLLPAGLDTYRRSQGGFLYDDPKDKRVFTQDYIETLASMLASVELGAVMQNMSLMATALGLGGWPHFAGGTAWMRALGFEGTTLKSSKLLGLPRELALELRLANKDEDVWVPEGLSIQEGDKRTQLLKPYCPPYYSNMKEAVLAFVDDKFAKGGRFRKDGNPSLWQKDKDPGIRKKIEKYSDNQIQAAIDHATYVYDQYGRFPGKSGPLTTVTAFQVHHLEKKFYEEYYGVPVP